MLSSFTSIHAMKLGRKKKSSSSFTEVTARLRSQKHKKSKSEPHFPNNDKVEAFLVLHFRGLHDDDRFEYMVYFSPLNSAFRTTEVGDMWSS